MHDIKRVIQVNVSFTRLWDGRIDHFTRNGLNPEIVFDARALERFSRDDFSAVAEALRKNALTVTFHAPFVDLSAGSSDPAVRDVTRRRFEELLALVPLFRPVTVVAHAGYDWKRYEYFRDEWLANSLEFWSWLSDGSLAFHAGITATEAFAGFFVGGAIGMISSLVGIGGGSLSVPFMAWCNIPVHRAIGTSAATARPIPSVISANLTVRDAAPGVVGGAVGYAAGQRSGLQPAQAGDAGHGLVGPKTRVKLNELFGGM